MMGHGVIDRSDHSTHELTFDPTDERSRFCLEGDGWEMGTALIYCPAMTPIGGRKVQNGVKGEKERNKSVKRQKHVEKQTTFDVNADVYFI